MIDWPFGYPLHHGRRYRDLFYSRSQQLLNYLSVLQFGIQRGRSRLESFDFRGDGAQIFLEVGEGDLDRFEDIVTGLFDRQLSMNILQSAHCLPV